MAQMPLTIGIIGLGLLGASLGMALRDKNVRRLGWARRPEIRRRAVLEDVVDRCFDAPEELCREADLTLLAVPLEPARELLHRLSGCWRPGSVVSDVGSLKSAICNAAAAELAPRGVSFVGSHPMAGTEKSGFDAAFPALYDNADVFVVPGEGVPEAAVQLVCGFWEQLGTHPRTISARHHDELVARTSHVLHILASALARSILLSRSPEELAERFAGCATGFKDTSRIASSNPGMWREIISGNREAVLTAMAEFESEYFQFKELIASGDFAGFERLFAEGKTLRDRWVQYKTERR